MPAAIIAAAARPSPRADDEARRRQRDAAAMRQLPPASAAFAAAVAAPAATPSRAMPFRRFFHAAADACARPFIAPFYQRDAAAALPLRCYGCRCCCARLLMPSLFTLTAGFSRHTASPPKIRY
jgi:hypothetical protein